MRVLILGTGDAFTQYGFGTSAIIQGPEGYVLIDCPDLIHRAIRSACDASGWRVSASDIHHIILTHLHGDHSNGLESFGFDRFVDRLKDADTPLPTLHTHPAAAERVWEKLAPAMDAPLHQDGKPATLADFYNLHIIEPEEPATVAGLNIRCRYSIHPVPTIGLKISDGNKTLGWSGDTVFDADHIQWLSDADLIVHEANLGPAHTHIELLNQLPDDVRKKMRVTHIIDDYNPAASDIPPLNEGEVLVLE